VLGSQTNVSYVVIDGTMFASLTPNNWLNLGKASDVWDPTTMLNPNAGFANLLSNFGSPETAGDETLDGLHTVRVEGTVTEDAVNKIFPGLANAPVPTTAWIRPDTGDLVRLTLQPRTGQSIQFDLSDWGKAVTITRPPGV
jgi:lipoprotein LprG